MKLRIEVTPNTEMKKTSQKEQVQFHTFELKSGKPLKVIFRGVATEVKQDLKEWKHPVSKITRMQALIL